ncbi:MAG: hypothetical protein R6W90_13940 [Ignavibacteriaceae bacterium]
MTNNSKYKLHLPIVRVTTTQKINSVSPHKILITKDKYQDRTNNEWEEEFYDIYKSFNLEGKG